MYTFESATVLTKNIADLCTNLLTIVITASIVLFIIYLRYVFCRKDEKWNKEKIQYLKSMQKKEYTWQCLLIDGAWGSGKTTHYENNYKYIADKPNIYISCFSASRSELIAQIIQEQFWCKLLTLNGLLAKFMESNWKIFMPKNRVVVFDDLERLHTGKENYLDLIGIVDHLKNRNECKIILICNMSELKSNQESNPHIFNSYMERIVDTLKFPALIPENEFIESLINKPEELTKKLLSKLYPSYADGKINNLRIIKNIMPKIADKLGTDYSEFNEIEQVINGAYYELIKLINKHYLFYIDNALFKECSDINNGKTSVNQIAKTKLEARLNKFNLKHEDFQSTEYKSFRDIKKILNPDLGNYLKGDIEVAKNNFEIAKVRINEYLDKFTTGQSKNSFVVYKEPNIWQNDGENIKHDNSSIFILFLCYLVWLDKGSEQIIDKVALKYINSFGMYSVCNINLRIAFVMYGQYFKISNPENYFNDNILKKLDANESEDKLVKFKKILQNNLVKCKLNNIKSNNDIYELPFVSYSSNGIIYSYEELWEFCNSTEDQIIYKRSYEKKKTKKHSIDVTKQNLPYIIENIIEIIYCYCNSQIFNKILDCGDQKIVNIYHDDFIRKLNENQVGDLQLSEYINSDLLVVLKQRLSSYLTKIIQHFEYPNLDCLLDNIKDKATKELLKNLLENENIK